MDEDTFQIPELELRGRFTCHAAPVQVEGTVAQHAFYFRAKYDEWSFSVALSPEVDPADICFSEQGFYRDATYGVARRSEASFMSLEEARRIIVECATEFLRGRAA